LVERANGYLETSFLPGRVFVSPDDFNAQLNEWLVRANTRTVRSIGGRPVDLLEADYLDDAAAAAGRPADRSQSPNPFGPEIGSIMVTSNLPFGRWGGTFSGDVVAAAMIDRLVHHAEVLDTSGTQSCS
jgi:IstB-like ATP binding protein